MIHSLLTKRTAGSISNGVGVISTRGLVIRNATRNLRYPLKPTLHGNLNKRTVNVPLVTSYIRYQSNISNNDKTQEFFEEHEYFGYPKEKIKFFKQGNLPLISEDGKLLVDEKFNIKYAADGNGCIYKAMRKNGIIEDMKEKGIKWVFIGSVDNALLNMVDPILLGLTVSQNNMIGSKSVVKRSPEEPVEVFCKKNNKPAVIEYTELPTEMAKETDEDG